MKTRRISLLLVALPLVGVSANEPVDIIFDADISGDVNNVEQPII